MSTSVLTLVRGRATALSHFVRALARQSLTNFELVIATMQRTAPVFIENPGFPVRIVHVPGKALPLARARNAAVAAACGERLIFLDIDCIALPGLVARYAHALDQHDACLMGEVRYLARGAVKDCSDYAALWSQATSHPARPMLPANDGQRTEPDAGQLWGLSFALRRARFAAAGGFDQAYCGYGGEETDFAARLAAIDTRFVWLGGAQAVHQWHPIARPPLDHFDAIIANAQRFRARWGHWCLDYWLEQFAVRNFIRWRPDATSIDILHRPSDAEIAHAFRCGEDRLF